MLSARAAAAQPRLLRDLRLDEDEGDEAEDEPLYGATYLPRKFKIGLAHPADNTIDVLANDLGLIAVLRRRLPGYRRIACSAAARA